jgi:hypothetical protein
VAGAELEPVSAPFSEKRGRHDLQVVDTYVATLRLCPDAAVEKHGWESPSPGLRSVKVPVRITADRSVQICYFVLLFDMQVSRLMSYSP